MDVAPKAHGLIGTLVSFLGQGRSFVLRLTLFAIAVFGLFQFISASGFGTSNDEGLTSMSVQISSFFSLFLSPASRTLFEPGRMSYYQVTSGRVLVTGGGGNIGRSYSDTRAHHVKGSTYSREAYCTALSCCWHTRHDPRYHFP